MLVELRVENLGIIAELTVPIGAGMTAITGETGAGKTLLVEALQLLLGGRADGALVRDGAAEARVDGRFHVGDDEVVLSRVVPNEGRSRAYINGRPVTAGELGAVGGELVDLHGQHDQQSLLVPAAQRALLDAWIGAPAEECRAELGLARVRLTELEAALGALGGDERTRAREIDLLRFQIGEIDAVEIATVDEDVVLGAEVALLDDAEAHRQALTTVRAALDDGASEALGNAQAALVGRDPFVALSERLRALQDDVAELAREIRLAAEAIVADPERLAAIRERRARLGELRRKYGDTLAEVLDHRHDSQARLDELETHDERAAALEAELADVVAERHEVAARLSALRTKHAPKLAAAVTARLRELALPHATVSIRVETMELHDDGADRITFELAPNPGESARPLAKAASGGELSRTMLAIRAVLSAAPPTLVFDEVDAGIGGEAGIAVGAALRDLAGAHQVLCVTHLAQVAAHADAHLHVSKATEGDRTVAAAEILLDEARVRELSRMLAGVGESEHARSHADELLRNSTRPRREPAKSRSRTRS